MKKIDKFFCTKTYIVELFNKGNCRLRRAMKTYLITCKNNAIVFEKLNKSNEQK